VVSSDPFVLVVTGPAGVGKTTVAARWAASRAAPTAHVSLDALRRQVVAGYADPRHGWTDHAAAQHRLARGFAAHMALGYVQAGQTCIVDDAVFPDRDDVGWGPWDAALRGSPRGLVVIWAPLAEVAARNAMRSPPERLPDAILAEIHGRMAGWRGSGHPIVDSGRASIDETVAGLGQAIDSMHLA
jgi:hypothetical protein